MKTSPGLIPLACTLALIAASSASAAPQVRLEPLISYYHYREVSDTGQQLNREAGPLYGGQLSLSDALGTNWFWLLSVRELRGSIDYRGQTQSGAALSTQTRHRHQQVGGQLGRCLDRCRTRVHAGLAYYERERDIRPTDNSLRLLEHYRGWELGLGARQELLPGRLWVSAELSRTRSGEVQPDLRELGYGRPGIPLPDTWGLYTQATLALFRRQGASGHLKLGYLYRNTAQSESVRVNRAGGGSATLLQPESELHQWQTGVHFRFRY
jgi:hypothetical protein